MCVCAEVLQHPAGSDARGPPETEQSTHCLLKYLKTTEMTIYVKIN